MYNLLIGGGAGQGIETTVSILEKFLKKSGYFVYTTKDIMSRVRGGHNFSLIRFSNEIITSHNNQLDGMIALDKETVALHKNNLKPTGFLLGDISTEENHPQYIPIDIKKVARDLGNVRTFGTICVGAILRLFGCSLNSMEEILNQTLKSSYIDLNKKAIESGYNAAKERFTTKKAGSYQDWMLISGNQSLALGAAAAGLKFFSAYPMSPSTSIMEYLASKSSKAEIVVEQAEDEIAAINMAIGASFTGVRAMTATSGGGFCLKVEALGLSGMAEIPLVVVDVQRPGPATGLPTRTEQSDLSFAISASHGEFPRMVIALRDQKDAFYQTIRAFYLAERYQIPVILLSDQYLADTTATVEPFDWSTADSGFLVNDRIEANNSNDTSEYLRYRYTEDGISPRLIPGKTKHFVTADSDEHNERGWITEASEVRIRMMQKRMKKIDSLQKELKEPTYIGSETCDTLLLGWGSTLGPITEAVKTLNENHDHHYGALIFGDIYPLPQVLLREKSTIAKQVINIEQNATGQLSAFIRQTTGIKCTSSILKYDGRQISGEEIVQHILKGEASHV